MAMALCQVHPDGAVIGVDAGPLRALT